MRTECGTLNLATLIAVGLLIPGAGCFVNAFAALGDDMWHQNLGYWGEYPGSSTYDTDKDAIRVRSCGLGINGYPTGDEDVAGDSLSYAYYLHNPRADFDYVLRWVDWIGTKDAPSAQAGFMVRQFSDSVVTGSVSEHQEVAMINPMGGFFAISTPLADAKEWCVQWRPEVGAPVTMDETRYVGNYSGEVGTQWLRIRKLGDTFYAMGATTSTNAVPNVDELQWKYLWAQEVALDPFDKGLAVGVYAASGSNTDNTPECLVRSFQTFPQKEVSIVDGLKNAEVFAGKSYRFQAKVSGYTPLNYKWKKDGEVIASGMELYKNTISYTVEMAELSDAGKYTLEVSNTANGVETTVTTSAKLVVRRDNEAPEIESVNILGNTVGITFTEPVDSLVAGNYGNYLLMASESDSSKIPPGIIEIEQLMANRVTLFLDREIALGEELNVGVQNIMDYSGNYITNMVSTPAVATYSVANVGNPFKKGSAVALGGDGYYLTDYGFSGYMQDYEEQTFVCREYKGDFDLRTRVLPQDVGSATTMMGLQVRTDLSEGAEAPHSAYAKIYHLPVQSMTWDNFGLMDWYSAPVDNIVSIDGYICDNRHSVIASSRREVDGVAQEDAFVDTITFSDGTVMSPWEYAVEGRGNLWIRIGREGDVINTYYGFEEEVEEEEGEEPSEDQGQSVEVYVPVDEEDETLDVQEDVQMRIVWKLVSSFQLADTDNAVYAGVFYELCGNSFGESASLRTEFMNPTANFSAAAVSLRDYSAITPVSVLKNPSDVLVFTGDPFSLSVEGAGDPLAFQWYKNDVPIKGATKATYTVESADLSDSGTYYCELMNFGNGAVDKGYTAKSLSCKVEVRSHTSGDVPDLTIESVQSSGGILLINVSWEATETAVVLQYASALNGEWETLDVPFSEEDIFPEIRPVPSPEGLETEIFYTRSGGRNEVDVTIAGTRGLGFFRLVAKE